MYEREEIQKFLATRVARPSSAGVILENTQGEALLLKAHYKPYWSFPGGWVEDVQTPLQAALRELQEEAGVELSGSDVEFAFVVDRISDVMHTYQFMFRGLSPVDDMAARVVLQADEIADWRMVSRKAVQDNPDEYGGAVLAWARSDESGYLEQAVSQQGGYLGAAA